MLKRIVLFALTNILVMLTITALLSFLGVGNYIRHGGIDYQSLMIICLVWGMAGSFISLALSRVMAKWMMGVKVIDPQATGELGWLVQTVYGLARQANLPKMPEVGVFDSPEVNAFATGPTKARALVAVSSGLLRTMNKEQIEGVLGHEMAHIQNGDMVTMTLLQGVVNAFVMFLSRVIAFALAQNVKEEQQWWVRYLVTIVLQIALGLLGIIVVAWFSRQREFRADAGGAKLAGRDKMTSALQALQRIAPGQQEILQQANAAAPAMAAFKISGQPKHYINLFSTHPPLAERIQRLQQFR